jgi:hypothetical protein
LAAFRERSTIVGFEPAASVVVDGLEASVLAAVATLEVKTTPPTVIFRSALRRSTGRRTRLRKSLGTRYL